MKLSKYIENLITTANMTIDGNCLGTNQKINKNKYLSKNIKKYKRLLIIRRPQPYLLSGDEVIGI